MPNPQYYLICKQETRILVDLPNPPKFLFITQGKILEQIFASKPSRAKSGCKMEKEREMREKSSSITLAKDMVRKRVREGFYLYLERQTYLSWINAKCPPPSTRENPKKGGATLGFWLGQMSGR